MIDYGWREIIKLAIFYGSFLYFPAAAAFVWIMLKRSGAARNLAALILAPLTALAYARFVEPRILLTVEHKAELDRCLPAAGSARLALLSDTHEGLFGNAVAIDRIARRVNAANPDAVFIAGDLTYFVAAGRYDETFAALGAIEAPVFAVFGNHDIGLPGPNVAEPLTGALKSAGVAVIDNEKTAIAIGGARIEIVGLSDLWGEAQDRTLLEKRGDVPRLVLTHNPETILGLKPSETVDFMLAGHTHGGQINIPFVTCALTSACRVTRYGLKKTERGKVFVTSGTGMVALPMRFNAVPRIDVINLSWRSCS